MRWFFFGSLLDPDVLAVVLDRPATAYTRRYGTLYGYRRVRVIEESYPALIHDPDGRVDGLLVEPLGAEDERRVCFFEGEEFQPRSCPIELHDGEWRDARVFLTAGLSDCLHDQPWDFHIWRIRHKARFLEMARDFMAGYHTGDWYHRDERWKAAERASRNRSLIDRTEN
jgi:hypothetical protein